MLEKREAHKIRAARKPILAARRSGTAPLPSGAIRPRYRVNRQSTFLQWAQRSRENTASLLIPVYLQEILIIFSPRLFCIFSQHITAAGKNQEAEFRPPLPRPGQNRAPKAPSPQGLPEPAAPLPRGSERRCCSVTCVLSRGPGPRPIPPSRAPSPPRRFPSPVHSSELQVLRSMRLGARIWWT